MVVPKDFSIIVTTVDLLIAHYYDCSDIINLVKLHCQLKKVVLRCKNCVISPVARVNAVVLSFCCVVGGFSIIKGSW